MIVQLRDMIDSLVLQLVDASSQAAMEPVDTPDPLDELDGMIVYDGPEEPECTAMGPQREIEPEQPGERERLQQLMERHKPMSDFSAARFASTLVTVVDKAGQMSGDGDGDAGATLRIEMAGAEEYAE